MAKISQRKVREMLMRSQSASTMHLKGKYFEDLVCYLFQCVPGIEISARNTLNPYRSEEIDVCFWNNRRHNGLHFLPNTILVEAKNWSTPAGSQEITHFESKLRNHDCSYGFFVALNGVSGEGRGISSGRDAIRMALTQKIKIIVMKESDIRHFSSGSDIITFAKLQLCQLAASGTHTG